MDVVIGNIGDDHLFHIQLSPFFPLVAALLAWAASFGWRLRQWVEARRDWLSASIQAALTSAYGVLLFGFFSGSIEVIWIWRLFQAGWRTIERAYTVAIFCLPYLYVLGAAFLLLLLFLDCRRRPGFQKLAYLAFALCFAAAFWKLSPVLKLQMDEFKEMARIAPKEGGAIEIGQTPAAAFQPAIFR